MAWLSRACIRERGVERRRSRSSRRSWSRSSLVAVCALAASLGAVGCDKEKDDPLPENPGELAADGAESMAVETDSEVVTTSLVSATNNAQNGGNLGLASTDLELAGDGVGTQGSGDGPRALYFPRGCLTVGHDPATRTVDYDFGGCTGPNGIFRVAGDIKATYESGPNRLVLQLVGTGLTVNRATVDWTASAEITTNGPVREMKWRGQLTGTTGKGKAFSRTNEKVVTWRFGERCFEVTGVSSGAVRGRQIETDVRGYRRCQGGCPEAGGVITITDVAKSRKVEVRYDGTNQATFVAPTGVETRFQLGCTAS